MASQNKSFADLVADAPAAAAEGTVSLVGALAKSREAGKFVLTTQDGRTVTLETSAVKGHSVLGSSLGRAIVRIEIEASKAPALGARRSDRGAISSLLRFTGILDQIGQGGFGEGDDTPPFTSEKDPGESDPFTSEKNLVETDPDTDSSDPLGESDPVGEKDPDGEGTGSREFIDPFALATPHQAPPNVVRAMQARAGYARRFGGRGWGRGAMDRKPVLDNAKVLQDSYGTGYWGDLTNGPGDIW
jgi:hypothetical protein